MGFDDGQIILDSENGAYYSGQTVYGRVVFEQSKVETIHGIYVDMKGFCKVHWSTTHTRRVNDRQQSYTVNHDSHEEYFRNKTFIFGTASGEHHLQPGKHEFKFECHIPANCPSSFEGSHGHIRYRIKVVMVTSGMFSMNKDKMVPIKVHAPLDLNQNPYCKEPMQFELLSSYCCWCVSAGSSEVLVRMPVGGYCPGQVIPMEVTCKNPSSVEIDQIKFAIKRNVKFIATSQPGNRYDHDTVAEITKGPVPPRTTRNWTVEMDVPDVDLYNVDACQYIDITYYFKVSTEVGGCHEGTEEIHPIIFGTIPLVGFQDNIKNPLQDQMPKPMEAQNVTSTYPPPPIINQPLPNPPYPNGNGPYPTSPYPAGNPGYPTTPNFGANPPYPPGNQPLPNVSPYPPNPYPGSSPYPGANPPYPGTNSPYSAGSTPYPSGNAPYPTNTPYSTDNSPHEGNPGPVPPYPGGRQSPMPPYPSAMGTTLLKTGTFGFTVPTGDAASLPLLPPGANVPYPTSPPTNPYATASAPEPSTPGCDDKKSPLNGTSDVNSPYNPEFMNDKKDEKTN